MSFDIETIAQLIMFLVAFAGMYLAFVKDSM
jgi:hypothetical protein